MLTAYRARLIAAYRETGLTPEQQRLVQRTWPQLLPILDAADAADCSARRETAPIRREVHAA